MNKIKAVLFDMDGVLIDAREWHYESLNKALSLFGYHISRQEHESYYDGLPTKVKLKRLSEEKGLPESLHEFINKMKQQYTIDSVYNNSTIDFWKQSMLKKLKNKNIHVACCSNSIRNSIHMMLDKAMLLNYFDLIISNEDVTEAKPSPQIYLQAMKHFWISPEETIIVEDSPHGIEAATKSGAHVLRVKDPSEVHSGLFKDIIL